MGGDSERDREKTTFHSRERGMTKKTLELIVAIVAFATEVLVVIKDKINGRKHDDKGVSKKE
jgi:hypothetical protein